MSARVRALHVIRRALQPMRVVHVDDREVEHHLSMARLLVRARRTAWAVLVVELATAATLPTMSGPPWLIALPLGGAVAVAVSIPVARRAELARQWQAADRCARLSPPLPPKSPGPRVPYRRRPLTDRGSASD